MIASPIEIIDPRRNDPTGHGDYGTSRGTKKHRGFDLNGKPGTNIYAPFSGFITKIGYPYSFDLSFRYVEITNDTYRTRLHYVAPDDLLKKGDRITIKDYVGGLQDVAGFWNKNKKKGQHLMRNHLHWEMWKNGLLTDPEPLLIKPEWL